jgi:hypothetical protein
MVCLGRAKGLVLSDNMEDRAYRQIDAADCITNIPRRRYNRQILSHAR